MTRSSLPRHCLAFILALVIGLAELPSPVRGAKTAAPPPAAARSGTTPPTALFAGFGDYIIGNRSRMIQFAFIGFVIGVVILMTATRKH